MTLRSPSCLLVVLVVVMVKVLLDPAALAQCTAPMDPCTTPQDCSSCDTDNGGYIPDPEDCHGYYICVNNSAFLPLPAKCPEGETFDPTTLECNATADCFTCPQECVFKCSDPSTPSFVSSFSDCNEYYECDNGVAVGPMHCDSATDPFFDGEICQPEETRCCRCQPSCAGEPSIVIDPLDCRKYWICTATTPPVDTGKCPEGMVFDTALQDCSATSTCETTCPNVVNITGCIDPFICSSTGYFAMCPNLCVNEYYYCEDVSNEYQEPEHCFTGTYFHPDNHICVNLDDCPYPEPESLRVRTSETL